MSVSENDLPYTILTKVEGKPQLLKLAPAYVPEPEVVPVLVSGPQHPLAGQRQKYPLEK